MSSMQTLPPELWLIIFDFVVASSIGLLQLLQHSNHITFPEFLHQYRSPWAYPPTLCNIRLVCRAFNDLLAPSPYLFIKNSDTTIPNSSRAVFISPNKGAQVLLQHLLAEPSKSQRIVMLDLAVYEYPNVYSTALFDLLCGNGHSLPNLESLNLTLPLYEPRARILLNLWSRLNNAFPRLVCLVLRGRLNSLPELKPVIFERLKIIDFDATLSQPNVHFPMLHHAAFGFVTYQWASGFTGWELLESLLIREAGPYSRIDFWNLVPQLVLLGLPSRSVEEFAAILPCPYPLQHLYIYVAAATRNDHHQDPERKDKELEWLKGVLEHLPTVKRLTLAHPLESNHRSSSIRGDFDEEELAVMGFFRDYSDVRSSHKNRRTVLLRLDSQPQIEPHIGAVSQHKGVQTGWNRFSSFVSRKFHF